MSDHDKPQLIVTHDVEDPAATAELRDIHRRIDSLKQENERQYSSLTEKIHALEVAVVCGNRFPANAWVAAAALFMTVIGTGFVTFNKIETAMATSNRAISLIEKHMEGSGERFATIRQASAVTEEWEKRLPSMEERLRSLESRIVGQGPNGWHRGDHELYAKMMDERHERIRGQLEILEKRQDDICERIENCGGKHKK